ncbi:MAG: response regulator [Phycisphaerae bacterium]|nr:response regulator [Phycisphaerae bacterium]
MGGIDLAVSFLLMEQGCDYLRRDRDLNILIVEDEAVARSALASLLTSRGFVTQTAESAEAALDRLKDGSVPEVALIDLDLPGMNGAELIRRLKMDRPNILPILITAEVREKVVPSLPAVHYLRKPFNFDDLLHAISDIERPSA